MSTIADLGGNFNPPMNGHLNGTEPNRHGSRIAELKADHEESKVELPTEGEQDTGQEQGTKDEKTTEDDFSWMQDQDRSQLMKEALARARKLAQLDPSILGLVCIALKACGVSQKWLDRSLLPAIKDALLKPGQAAQVQGEPSTGSTTRFPRLTLAQMMDMPPKEWLIDQIIGPRDLVTIYGAPGSGKTFVSFDLAFSACVGGNFAGRFGVLRPLTVAYAAGEGGSGLAQRFRAAAEYYSVEDGNLPNLHIFINVPQLYDATDPCNAVQFVEEYAAAQAAGDVEPLDILILDTLHSVTNGADENSSQHMGKVLYQAKAIAERLGCAVILVHHNNKQGTGERGSSALRGAMDTMIEVKRVKEGSDERIMLCQKLKDGEQWKPQAFGLAEQADSVYVEWGDASESGAGESKMDEREQPKNDKGRQLLGLLYQVEYGQDEYPKGHNDNPGWLITREVALELGGKGLSKNKLKVLIEAFRSVLKRLQEKGYVISAMLDRDSSSVQHWSISDTGKSLWETIRDDESIWV